MVVRVDTVLQILHENGAFVESFTDNRAVLTAIGSRRRVPYIIRSMSRFDQSRASAWQQDAAAHGANLLVVVDRVSEAVIAAAVAGSFSYLALRERSWFAPRVHQAPLWEQSPSSSYARCALVRALLSTALPARQGRSKARVRDTSGNARVSLSERSGVSQAQVSDLLDSMPDGIATQVEGGWVAGDFEVLWNWHMNNYPGPGESRLTWRSRRALETQEKDLSAAINAAAEADVLGQGFAVALRSGIGAVAPTLRSGERQYEYPLIMLSDYLTTSLTEKNYTACAETVATVQLVKLEDPYARSTAAAWGSDGQTDPLVTAYELARDPRHRDLVEPNLAWAAAHVAVLDRR